MLVRDNNRRLLRARLPSVNVFCPRWLGAASSAGSALPALLDLLLRNLFSELRRLVLKLRRLSLFTQERIVTEDGAESRSAIDPSSLIEIQIAAHNVMVLRLICLDRRWGDPGNNGRAMTF